MEAASRGAQDAGATSIGLTIELAQEQATTRYADVEVPFRYCFARKLAFVRYASAFRGVSGRVWHPRRGPGFGTSITVDQLFEALDDPVGLQISPPCTGHAERRRAGPLLHRCRDRTDDPTRRPSSRQRGT
ncbi:MAG: hypothetical protein ACLGIZ_12875 [Acidimicrobiia bacterium]